jgi:NADPH:quinone reductase-like Zn-dependent oxidoreductase
VLVRVEASGVNPVDTKIRAGLAGHARTEPPAVLGIDLAGTVEMVADDVTAFTPGDRVYGMTGGVGGVPGSLADYTLVDARLTDPQCSNPTSNRTPRQCRSIL